ncbi:carboxylating nicotinate-nucleotide diphosphorylase [Alkaliphilus peptidifermentans]|uniref:Probable nicotinate-nucleotide pyrophosphorylase [carboxylating] n=1 Tax=Alkaliphilus peptidifermentans DSM 18978 TaxID=1120976 RepID=A0A1G5AXL6_9FIRM|nr:carboxylating nicotinate-nucleotide diphosphorylase [Alkaliphilus peptidifermentans]SCX82576.1 nicotinate-nucleotide pyrophosphorylase [carboxylating] [Alkaliphilus peptidifermentans DSM 18978]
MINQIYVNEIIKRAIIEDLNFGDITTDTLINDEMTGKAIITAKENGVIAGLKVIEEVFKILDADLKLTHLKKDGDEIKAGEDFVIIEGRMINILKGERIALNFLQRMSGIATKAKVYNDLVKDYNVRIVDTRKTTPGLRGLEKYAVKAGGCNNHRYNLSDAVLIKDNHIKAVGSISEAIKKCKKDLSHTVKIEIEVENLQQLKEALKAGADIILLDNMDVETMKEAVEIAKGKAILEASGNITEDRVKAIAATGVDIISIGALTHSVKALDISLNIILNK